MSKRKVVGDDRRQLMKHLQQEETLGVAAIDRLVHHSIILELNLPSYRLEQSQNAKEKSENQGG